MCSYVYTYVHTTPVGCAVCTYLAPPHTLELSRPPLGGLLSDLISLSAFRLISGRTRPTSALLPIRSKSLILSDTQHALRAYYVRAQHALRASTHYARTTCMKKIPPTGLFFPQIVRPTGITYEPFGLHLHVLHEKNTPYGAIFCEKNTPYAGIFTSKRWWCILFLHHHQLVVVLFLHHHQLVVVLFSGGGGIFTSTKRKRRYFFFEEVPSSQFLDEITPLRGVN